MPGTTPNAPSLFQMWLQGGPQSSWSQYLAKFQSPVARGMIPMDPFSAYRQNYPNYLPPGMINPAPLADAYGGTGPQAATPAPWTAARQQGRGPPRPAAPQMPNPPGFQPADWMRAFARLSPQQFGTGNAATNGVGGSDPNTLRAGAMGAALMGGMPFGMVPFMLGNFQQR